MDVIISSLFLTRESALIATCVLIILRESTARLTLPMVFKYSVICSLISVRESAVDVIFFTHFNKVIYKRSNRYTYPNKKRRCVRFIRSFPLFINHRCNIFTCFGKKCFSRCNLFTYFNGRTRGWCNPFVNFIKTICSRFNLLIYSIQDSCT